MSPTPFDVNSTPITRTLRQSMYVGAGLVVLGMLALLALSFYSIHAGIRSLSAVYDQKVVPTAALMRVDTELKEIRFRLAAYLVDQTPSVGNRLHLTEARVKIRESWKVFLGSYQQNRDATDQGLDPDLIAQIDAQWPDVEALFDRLDHAYRSDQKEVIRPLLEDEWPVVVHLKVLKPLSRALPALESSVKRTYDTSVSHGQRVLAGAVLGLVVMVALILVYVFRLIRRINRQFGAVAASAERIASGDLSTPRSQFAFGEIEHLARSIDHMREKIRLREHGMESAQRRLQSILDNAAEGIVTFDQWGVIEQFSHSAERLFGWREAEIVGLPVANLMVLDDQDQRDGYLSHFLRQEIQKLIGQEGEVAGRHKDGTTFPMAIKISPMRIEGERRYVALIADISERKAMVDNLRRLAELDGLTGLYNRTYFQQELERAVERARRAQSEPCALLYIDLDHFKYVNDTLGHAAGDRLLVEATRALTGRARKSDLLARMGGDEFTVLAYGVDAAQAVKLADSFREILSDFPFNEQGQSLAIGCSIGVAVLDAQVESTAVLLSQADYACREAKRSGRNRVHMFSANDAKNATAISLDMGWSQRIKRAIAENRFALACQPIVSTKNREIAEYEVLIRMLDERGEILMPGAFLSAAERFGLAVDIDKWVVVNAIETLVRQRRNAPKLRYAINLSAHTLSDPNICDLIEYKLSETGLAADALTFEVTETAAIADMNLAKEMLGRLKSIGCHTALDDFGSGMASFAYLRELPVDIVKIDGRFVRNLDKSPVDQALVRAMNDVAHALGKRTVAEFVENETSFVLLASFGVDFGQGYHLGRPDMTLPCREIAENAGGAEMCRVIPLGRTS